MNNMFQLIKTPHMACVVGLLFALQVAAIVWPEGKAKLDEIRKLAYMYAIILAGAYAPPTPPADKPAGQP